MPKVIHFNIKATKPEKLKEFYEEVFDWKFIKWDESNEGMDYYMIDTGEGEQGIDGGMTLKRDLHDQTEITIGVKDIDSYLKIIEACGGKITSPKMSIPGYGWIINFEDPQGNNYSIMEEDSDAK